ncbi:MAG: Gfo/Idh/MocA family oxidoreductase [Gemmatales bacterium]|nr:Gfo/Idh/MocA family oxidoreductase [Gemmatales bacterium]MDW8386596.1 Gfo/Idh/MocA family oxidoreductase [Gemmatales bacterium]
MASVTRREFSKAMAAGTATLWAGGKVLGAGDRIRLGFIGVGNRGDQLLDAFRAQQDCEITAVCDLHQPYLDFAVNKLGGKAAQFKDYRALLDSKDVDAVVIATPDHWHALQTIHACMAGKDVYVEKPLSLCVEEGRRMVAAARKHQRIVQVGLQRRSSVLVRQAVGLIRQGAIGKVSVIRAFHIQNEWPKGIDNPPNSEPPPGFDWDAWLGPAPKVPYNPNRTFYRFRWFYDYSGGQLTNFGVHYLDVIHWALGHDAPLAVTAMGGKFVIEDNREIPDTLEVLWTYPGNTLVTFSQYNANSAPAVARSAEIEFRGTKGTLYLNYGGLEILPEVVTTEAFPVRDPADRSKERGWRTGAKPLIGAMQVQNSRGDSTLEHARNFLDCVRSRKQPNCDVEIGHRDTTAAILGNIALKTKAYLEWDRNSERITNHAAANQFLTYSYRPPYQLPQV